MEYTERLHDYQIRDVSYWGKPPENVPLRFDIVKWHHTEPQEVNQVYYDEYGCAKIRKAISTEYCYSVGFLEWDDREPCFRFRSVGLRFFEEYPPKDVIDMILDFCEKKEKEILQQEGRWHEEETGAED